MNAPKRTLAGIASKYIKSWTREIVTPMAWMIALHKRPEDPVAYQQYYMDVHRPMAAKLPGLKRYILSDGPVTGGDAAGNFFFIALLEFESV